MEFDTSLDELDARIEEIRTEFGAKYRSDVLVPFCDLYRLKFDQGMGTYFFVTSSGEIISPYSFWKEGCLLMERMDEFDRALSAELGGSSTAHYLGAYIEPYDGRRVCLGRATKAVKKALYGHSRASSAFTSGRASMKYSEVPLEVRDQMTDVSRLLRKTQAEAAVARIADAEGAWAEALDALDAAEAYATRIYNPMMDISEWARTGKSRHAF